MDSLVNQLTRLKSVLDRDSGLVTTDLTKPRPSVELITMQRSSDGIDRQVERIRRIEQPGSIFMSDMCVGPESNVYVIVHNINQVKIEVYTPDGTKIKSNFGNRLFHRKLTRPALICCLGDRRLAVYDEGDKSVKIMFDSEDQDTQFEMKDKPDSMCSNVYGHLIFTHRSIESSIVTVRNPANGYLMQSIHLSAKLVQDKTRSQLTSTDAKSPSTKQCYVEIGGDSSIVVLDRRRCTISGYSPYGQPRYEYGESGSRVAQLLDPVDLALDPFGNILVADCKNDRIQRFSLHTGDAGVIVSEVKRPLAVSYTEGRVYVMTAKEIISYTYDLA